MNNDDFEKKLGDLTGSLRRPDPTPEWKADILARARREADAATKAGQGSTAGPDQSPVQHAPATHSTSSAKRALPPRWLMASWAAAWVAIAVLGFATPGEKDMGRTSRFDSFAAADSAGTPPIDPATGNSTQPPVLTNSPHTLAAFQYRLSLTNELP